MTQTRAQASDPVVEAVTPGLERHVEQVLADQRVVGAAIGIVRGEELAWCRGFGRADLDDERAPDERTLYRVDSNTKPVTGVAIMQLRDEGALHLDDPVVEYLPEFAAVEARAGRLEDVTLRRLLTHRSGLNGEVPGNWPVSGVGPSIEEVLSRLGECAIVIPPDSQHKYCNLGFVLLGGVVSRLTGRPYDEYVREAILEPLGMRDSTFDPDASELRRATQYGWSATSARLGRALQLTHNGRQPAGGLHSTVADMAKWVSLQFRRDRGLQRGGAQVLAGTSLAEMQRPQYAADDWQDGWCIAWGARRSGEHVYLGHGGGNPGSQSFTLFNVATCTGVVVLTNSDGHTAQLDLAKETLDRLLAEEARQPRPPRAPSGPPPEPLAPLLGHYENSRGTIMRVAWVDGEAALLGAGTGVPRELAWSGGALVPCHLEATGDPLALRARNGRLAGELLSFATNGSAEVVSMRLGNGDEFARLAARS